MYHAGVRVRALVRGRPGLAVIAKLAGARHVVVEPSLYPPYLLLAPKLLGEAAPKYLKKVFEVAKRGAIAKGVVILGEDYGLPGEEVYVGDDSETLKKVLESDVPPAGVYLHDALLIYIPYLPGVEVGFTWRRTDLECRDSEALDDVVCVWYRVKRAVTRTYIVPDEKTLILPLMGSKGALVIKELKRLEQLRAFVGRQELYDGIVVLFPPKGMEGVRRLGEVLVVEGFINAAAAELIGYQRSSVGVNEAVTTSHCFKLVM